MHIGLLVVERCYLNAGAKDEELLNICENWMTADRNASLYFV